MESKHVVIEFYENPEVNVNETADNYQFIKTLKNCKILTEKTEIDTSKVGKQSIDLEIKPSFGRKYVTVYYVSVVDRESPKILFTDFWETTEGEEIDLLKGVSATDNSNEEITVTIEGDYDFKTPGEYTLKYVACDSSSNKTEEEFTLKVKEKEKVVATVAPVTQPTPTTPSTEKEPTTKYETVTFTTSKGFSGITRDGVTYIDGYLIANKTYSLPSSYGNGITGETQKAFNTMAAAAKAEGLNIYIVSGFRSYDYQKGLYNRYANRDGKAAADTYSARPGHSEHQSGLSMDVNSVSNSFAKTPEGKWLAANCYKYGFILRYPEGKTNETGYIYEPWHFRYVGTDLAEKLYNGGDWITMESYFGITSEYK
ncbi:MAG: D-alanyl-D-alanine carboxypeptidase family protein [Oscillospiraceae bacterium]|nr:D-alanyl-D-alanine carboxypeptidase family protein [Oscillospiraceae bacterium]